MKQYTWRFLTTLAVIIGGNSLTAQEAKKAPPQSHSKPAARSGHYIPPRERRLDELIAKIRAANEDGRKIELRHRMSEAERERARNHRIVKAEGAANFRDGISGAESEYAIAADPTGQHIMVGYNLFADDPNGVSSMGVAYSIDGGQTFKDGGFLPSPGNQRAPDGTLLPFPFSDPDVKWVPGGGGCNFIYSSLVEVAYPATGRVTGTALTLGIHRSTDCGNHWAGPFEVKAATNPHGQTFRGSADDGADKEFMDVNPETGRVIISWSNFTSFTNDGIEVSTVYSDDIMTGNPPTFSMRSIVNRDGDGSATGSVPRFGPKDTQDVYVAYSRFADDFTRNVQVVASHDGGATWGPPVDIAAADFASMDDVLGNDRVNEFPSLAVDLSGGPNRGNIYVVYSDNDSNDGADVAFQTSRDRGATWSPIQFLNSRPGQDRGQWFPYVAVDKNTGRVSVIFYDQSVQPSGDLVQVLMTFSDDGGTTWSQPTPLTDRPFHAAYGNDSSAPNLGDYIGAVAQNGSLYAVWAGTPNSVLYTDAIPGPAMAIPTLFFKAFSGSPSPAVDLGAITVSSTAADRLLHKGDTAIVTVALRNPVTNPTSASTLSGIRSTLSSKTYGVTVLSAESLYPDLAPNASAVGSTPFQIALSPDFLAGTPIDFKLEVTSGQGTVERLFTQNTGTPQGTVILSENFDAVPSGSFPAGWTASHGGGAPVVAWTTTKTFCQANSNGLFHVNAQDGRNSADSSRWELAYSPTFQVPADAQWVTIDLDICYDTEDDLIFPTIGYDGAYLNIRDFTAGRASRSISADSFAESIAIGPLLGYPKHLSDNSSSANYFGDTSAWSGDSGGMQHVTMRLPGMAGSTVQLRFLYTQDQSATCKDVRPDRTICGVLIDNLVVRSVTSH